MKHLIFFIFSLLSIQAVKAQEIYLDSLYKVEPVKTAIYAEKYGERLIIDLYRPEGVQEKTPLIIFMHGGGFSGGSPKNPQEVEFAKIAASKGYTVGLFSYRLKRKATGFGCDFEASGKIETFQMAAEDFMNAISFIYDHAEKFKIDPNKIIVGGSSAGAEAVLNAVYNPDLMFDNPGKYSNIKFSAVISLAGAIVDARYLGQEQAIPGIFFHGTDDNLVPYATAPHHYCERSKPGYLILDGSKTIMEKLNELDSSYLFYSFKDARHEISGMPFNHLPEVFSFIKMVVFEKNKIQSVVFK